MNSTTAEAWLLLLSASFAAGALNGIAGGGSFLSFPALIVVGLPPIQANATNNTGTWIGYLASLYAYRDQPTLPKRDLISLIGLTGAGGFLGAVLLLKTPSAVFAKLIPYLLLTATLLFAVNPWLKRLRVSSSPPPSRLGLGLLQVAIALYGGFFGGGVGILLLALLGLMGMEDIHAMNALKTLLNASINGIALMIFVLSGTVAWPHALVMCLGTLLGGYWGIRWVRRVNPRLVRGVVIGVGLGMTLYFFVTTH